MHTSVGHSLTIFIAFYLSSAWHSHQIPTTPLDWIKAYLSDNQGLDMSCCFQKLFCPSIGTFNHISNTILRSQEYEYVIGIYIIYIISYIYNIYMVIHIHTPLLWLTYKFPVGDKKHFLGGVGFSSLCISSNKRNYQCKEECLLYLFLYIMHIFYHKSFFGGLNRTEIFQIWGKCSQDQPFGWILSCTFLQKATVFNPIIEGMTDSFRFPAHGLHS